MAELFVVTAKQAVMFVLEHINADAGCLTRLQLYSLLGVNLKVKLLIRPTCKVAACSVTDRDFKQHGS